MGIFDKFKKKEEIKENINTIGWDMITQEAERNYPGQTNPKHYASMIKWRFGGPDPLDGISIYEGIDYWHFVSYGLSELYDKESENKELSGYGMEFTFKLKKDNYDNEELEIKNVCGLLQQIAKVTFSRGELFKSYEYLYSGQVEGIDSRNQSNLTGFITIPDTNLRTLNTPNGKVEFVEFIGVTDAELKAVLNKELTVKQLYEKIGNDITNYHRDSVV